MAQIPKFDPMPTGNAAIDAAFAQLRNIINYILKKIQDLEA